MLTQVVAQVLQTFAASVGAQALRIYAASPPNRLDWSLTMNNPLRRLRRTVGNLVAEDRPGFKRVDVSPARYDDGSWLK